jgi:hypothetical protein
LTEAVWKRICEQCLTVRPDARRALGDCDEHLAIRV